MDAKSLFSQLLDSGFSMRIANGWLDVMPASRPGQEQREWIKRRKAELMGLVFIAVSNKSPVAVASGVTGSDTEREAGQAVLARFARAHGHSLEDLLDWYQDELADFGTMPLEISAAIVADYLDLLASGRIVRHLVGAANGKGMVPATVGYPGSEKAVQGVFVGDRA
ncbi:hypothetical protein CCP3SC5AM1_2550001 [Gammaproteobacteria bacterium]